jgi:PIN domain nuclease of toxin-antitoxin system
METIAHCDTHTVLWLYSGELDRFSKKGIHALESYDLRVSPIVRLEIQFLYEIERISQKPEQILRTLKTDFSLLVCNDPFDAVVEVAETIHWTRDPFDRLIVAQATLQHAPLITKDTIIRKKYKHCIW